MARAQKETPKKSSSWASAVYSTKTVIAYEPKLIIAGIFDELLNKSKLLIEAFIFARIVTLLPSLVDEGTQEQSLTTILYLLVGFVVLEIIVHIESSLYRLYLRKREIILDAKLNAALLNKFARVPYPKYEDKRFIDQYDLAFGHMNMIQRFVLWRLRGIIGNIYTIIIATILLVSFSWIIAALLLIVAFPQLYIEMRLNRAQRKIWRNTTASRRRAGAFSGLLTPRNIKDTRLFGLVEHAVSGYLTNQQQAEKEQLAVDREINGYRIAVDSLQSITTVSALAYTVFMIARGLAPIGQFVFVQQLIMRYMTSLSDVLWDIQELDEYLEGAEDFRDFMESPEEPIATGETDPASTIVFDNVSFTYPQALKPTLQNISLQLEPGKTYAFVGSNGAGKTTLLKLLMKLYKPTTGTIHVGEIDLNTVNEPFWQRKIGVLFQDFVSFWDFTLRDNVQFGDLRNADENKLKSAMTAAKTDGFIKVLPKQERTYLGKIIDEEHGIELSGGQLQRLAIARILFRDPEILIMDEPTSAVDAEAEFEIFQEINQSRKQKTTILVSHRFSTVRAANYIFVMEGGTIIEQGSHDELIAQNGTYARLFNLQAEGYR